jgi:hypothetical protein
VAAEPAELDDLAELIRDEVARQLAELLASDPPALRLLRKAE